MNKRLIFALAAVLACIVASVASQKTSEEQKAVLKAIAQEWPALKSLAIKPWTTTNIEKACNGSLSYVTSCNDAGWVKGLSFVSIGIPSVRVPIPLSLANMTGLETLTIGAFFGGALDVDFGKLESLRTLIIDKAIFTSPFPTSWASGMRNLEIFEWKNAVSQHQQPFPTFLQGKKALKRIFLYRVNVSGPIPSFIGHLPSLSILNLNSIDKITGPIPESLVNSSSLTSLHFFDLPSMKSSSMPSDWSKASSLSDISLRRLPISGSLPSKLPPLLDRLAIGSTLLDGTIPQAIVDHPLLRTLIISNTHISGTIPAPTDLENTNLYDFRVDHSEVTAVHADALRAKKLRYIDFSNNKLSGTLPPKLGPMIDSVYLQNNEFVGSIPSAYFGNTSLLEHFYVSSNKLSGELPAYLVECKKMIALYINRNSFSGQIPRWREMG